ncbi:proline rich transmembrane protein 1B-like [Lytechinus variegatus]|uniref:proline rich transmembrane protein 1B-like n=1 Tax=Lytechinus variegatus TaxID=7654 RepID=UPI001BB11970|nr:proline rich transmembrane protein 1B-like [Lytechinus variegatus]
MEAPPYDEPPSAPYDSTAIGNNAYAYGNAGYSTGPPAPSGGGVAPPPYPPNTVPVVQTNTVPVVQTVTLGVPIATTIHRQGAPPMPEKYIIHNILVLLFCCLLFGIIGIIKGSQVDSLYIHGHYEAAQVASLSARRWYLWGLWFGVIVYVVFLVTVLIVVLAV